MKITVNRRSPEVVGKIGGRPPKVNVLGRPAVPPFFNRYMISDSEYCVLPNRPIENLEIEVVDIEIETDPVVIPMKKGKPNAG